MSNSTPSKYQTIAHNAGPWLSTAPQRRPPGHYAWSGMVWHDKGQNYTKWHRTRSIQLTIYRNYYATLQLWSAIMNYLHLSGSELLSIGTNELSIA